jgi:hypothetical protein
MKDTSKKFQCRYTKETPTKLITCFKIQAEDSDFCPHHALIVADEALEPERRRERLRLNREARKAKAEALKISPLAGDNPNFGKKQDKTYSI